MTTNNNMNIIFSDVQIWASIGIDYFSQDREGLVNINASKYADLHNQWLPFPNSNGADVICTVIYRGEEIDGDINKVAIGVYETGAPEESLIIFPLHKIEEAIKAMHEMAGY